MFIPLLLLPAPLPPFMEFLTLVHSLTAHKVEPKPSRVGALDKCSSFQALFSLLLCGTVVCFSSRGAKAARGVADIVTQ